MIKVSEVRPGDKDGIQVIIMDMLLVSGNMHICISLESSFDADYKYLLLVTFHHALSHDATRDVPRERTKMKTQFFFLKTPKSYQINSLVNF